MKREEIEELIRQARIKITTHPEHIYQVLYRLIVKVEKKTANS